MSEEEEFVIITERLNEHGWDTFSSLTQNYASNNRQNLLL